MKIWKQLLALLLSGAMALSLFACGSGDAGPSASPDASAFLALSSSPLTGTVFFRALIRPLKNRVKALR